MILVTGGTGLVGSHVLYHCLLRGYTVKVLVRKTSDKDIIARLFTWYGNDFSQYRHLISWHDGDVLSSYSVHEAMGGVDKVLHCAGYVSFNPKEKQRVLEINHRGTENVVNACLERTGVQLGHVSSIAVFDKNDETPFITESDFWKIHKNKSAYAFAKFKGEMEVWRGVSEGLQAFVVNPSVVIGPGNWNRGSASMVKSIYQGMKFYTPGITGYVDVNDVAKCMLTIMEKGLWGERYILNSENWSFKEMFTCMANALGVKAPARQASPAMVKLAARLEMLKWRLSGATPRVTRDTANSAFGIKKYKNQKIIDAIDYNFLPIAESVKQTAEIFKWNY